MAPSRAHEFGRVIQDRGEGWVFGGWALRAGCAVGEGAAEGGSEHVGAGATTSWRRGSRALAIDGRGGAGLGLKGFFDSSCEALGC